jgi:hypothetical protein
MSDLRSLFVGLVLLLTVQACDTIQPENIGLLVVQGYFNADHPLPRVTVHESSAIDAALDDIQKPVSNANVVVTHNGTTIPYVPVDDSAGVYRSPPGVDVILRALDSIDLLVTYEDQQASGSGRIPPPVSIANVNVITPERAIEAVLIDSLNLGIDSLSVAIIASKGYIFPVEVELSWIVLEEEAATDKFWIQTRLDPIQKFSSSLLDFFLLSTQVLPEGEIDIIIDPVLGRVRRWTGIYAVPVPEADDILPPHELKISLLRSGQDYARLATTVDEPDRRSPAGNVRGGIGFVGGISVDSLSISVQ